MKETLLRNVLNKYTNNHFIIHQLQFGSVKVVVPVLSVRKQPAHVYVTDNGDGTYLLSDQRDLMVDAYGMMDSVSIYPYRNAFELLSRGYYPTITTSDDSFVQRVKHVDDLAASMFAFAGFIAHAMNLAQMEKDRDDSTVPHTY